jgi:hypothetical protein
MLTMAKSYNYPGYLGMEAGFLLALGELAGGVIHVDALLQKYEARAPRNRVVDGPLNRRGVGHYTPDNWEFGISQ